MVGRGPGYNDLMFKLDTHFMCSKNLTNKKQQVWYTTDNIVYIKSEPIYSSKTAYSVIIFMFNDLHCKVYIQGVGSS